MEQHVKKVFDKISMDDKKMVEIRQGLAHKTKTPKWTKAVACVAIGITVLFVIPSTRAMIVNAAEKFVRIFQTADGGEVIYEKTDNEVSFSVSYPIDCSYVEISGDKIYMTVDEKKIDVTEYCDKESYYRYEIVNNNGSRSVLFVGGSLGKVGYVELVFDENGKYIFNKMQVPIINDNGDVEPWVTNAMHNEGVPTGNIELDGNLYE